MKKLLTISILFVMVLAMCTSIVSATTNAELPDALMAIGEKYGATATEKIRLERYLADYPVTDEQANAILAKAQEVDNIMKAAGVTDVRKLTQDQKNQVKAVINEAAKIVGVTVVYQDYNVDVYKNGKKVDSVKSTTSTSASTSSNGSATTTSGKKLVYTGSNSYVAIAAGSIAVVALATIVIIKKKVVNA